MDLGQAQALPVADLEEAPDFSTPAATPEEFLARARWEARQLGDVFVDAAYEQQRQQQRQQLGTAAAASGPSLFRSLGIPHCTHPERLPSPLWENRFCASFGRLRSVVARWESSEELRAANPHHAAPPLPVSENRSSWKEHCAVQDPVLSTVGRIDQVALRELLALTGKGLQRLLEEMRDQTHGECASEGQCLALRRWSRWLFALGSRLEVPFDGDTSSVLRGILRSVCHLRNCWPLQQQQQQQDPEGEGEEAEESGWSVARLHDRDELACLNVCVCLCGKYFKQLSPDHQWEVPQ